MAHLSSRISILLNGALDIAVVLLVMNIQHVDCHMTQGNIMLPPGTTKYLAEIFSGRCSDYTDCTLPHSFQCKTNPQRSLVNCTAALYEFLQAFAKVDPCNVPDDAYDKLLTEAMIHSEPDETLFWSGTMEIAINIATVTSRYTSIERTLAGYILNGLTWCGQAAHGVTPTYQTSSCPRCINGKPDASYQFWRSASRHFAAQARGDVSLLLDSTRKNGAFRNTSTFAMEELPNIDPMKVDHVYIHLVQNVSAPINTTRETCDTGSIKVLRSLLETKGLNYTCTEDDLEFMMIQCVEYQDAIPCQSLFSSATIFTSSTSVVSMTLLSLSHLITFLSR